MTLAPGLPARSVRPTLLTRCKNRIVSDDRRPRRILSGPLRGIRMQLDLRTQTQLFLGLYEREIFPWIRRLAAGVRSAIDVGMAEGEFTLFLLMHTGAEVWAFEPDLAARPLFETNLELNRMARCPRLNLVERFAGDGDSPGEMRLDHLAEQLRPPCLIKVDAEGAEAKILSGAQGLDPQSDLRWIVETHSRELEIECVRILGESGFSTRIIAQAWWRRLLPDYRPLEQNRWLAAWRQAV